MSNNLKTNSGGGFPSTGLKVTAEPEDEGGVDSMRFGFSRIVGCVA